MNDNLASFVCYSNRFVHRSTKSWSSAAWIRRSARQCLSHFWHNNFVPGWACNMLLQLSIRASREISNKGTGWDGNRFLRLSSLKWKTFIAKVSQEWTRDSRRIGDWFGSSEGILCDKSKRVKISNTIQCSLWICAVKITKKILRFLESLIKK